MSRSAIPEKAMQVATAAGAPPWAAASAGNSAVAALTASEIGDLAENWSMPSSRKPRKPKPMTTPSTC